MKFFFLMTCMTLGLGAGAQVSIPGRYYYQEIRATTPEDQIRLDFVGFIGGQVELLERAISYPGSEQFLVLNLKSSVALLQEIKEALSALPRLSESRQRQLAAALQKQIVRLVRSGKVLISKSVKDPELLRRVASSGFVESVLRFFQVREQITEAIASVEGSNSIGTGNSLKRQSFQTFKRIWAAAGSARAFGTYGEILDGLLEIEPGTEDLGPSFDWYVEILTATPNWRTSGSVGSSYMWASNVQLITREEKMMLESNWDGLSELRRAQLLTRLFLNVANESNPDRVGKDELMALALRLRMRFNFETLRPQISPQVELGRLFRAALDRTPYYWKQVDHQSIRRSIASVVPRNFAVLKNEISSRSVLTCDP